MTLCMTLCLAGMATVGRVPYAHQDRAGLTQAFSYDDRTWETNWTADFKRADPAKACEDGRPRREKP